VRYIFKNKTRFLLDIVIILFIAIQGCNSFPVDAQPPKDPRNYTWTSDTLSFSGSAQVLMRSIWGSSTKDVYAVGHNDQSLGVMWHYDGNKWTDVKLNTPFQGGNISGTITLSSIYGFSSNNIYAVGDHFRKDPASPPNLLFTSRIIHFNGSTWIDVNLPSLGGWLNTVYGTSSSNVWTGGHDAIYHYDGVKWTRDSISVIVPSGSFFQLTALSSYNADIYALGLTDDNAANFTHYFFKENNSNISVIDTFYRANGIKFGNTLWTSKNGSLYSVGHKGVYKYNGSTWSNILKTGPFLSGISGTDDNNIFVVGHLGQAYHFNGTDWKNIADKFSKDSGTLYASVWTDGTEAFILEQPQTGFPQKTVVWHGK